MFQYALLYGGLGSAILGHRNVPLNALYIRLDKQNFERKIVYEPWHVISNYLVF